MYIFKQKAWQDNNFIKDKIQQWNTLLNEYEKVYIY